MALSDSYLDVAEFKLRTIMPSEDVDYLEAAFPGVGGGSPSFLASRLKIATSRINARLRKRYAVPFTAPIQEIVLGWVVAIVTVEAYQKRGWNPSDEQSKQIVDDAGRAYEEIKEAADAVEGLFDLPLRQDTTEDGISKGGPLVYSEASPWDWTDVQAEALRGR